MIPTHQPNFGDAELQAVAAVLKTGWLGMGPHVEEFESQLAELLGVGHVIAVNSGTAALHLAMEVRVLGVGSVSRVMDADKPTAESKHRQALLHQAERRWQNDAPTIRRTSRGDASRAEGILPHKKQPEYVQADREACRLGATAAARWAKGFV